MIVTPEELSKTTLYPEVIRQITRGDDEAVRLQIVAAEALAMSYLTKYDLKALFGTESEPPTHPNELVKTVVKTIASYYLLKMANPNVNIELAQLDYKDAIAILRDIRDGKNNLVGVPYAADDPETDEDEAGGEVSWSSNVKRHNHI